MINFFFSRTQIGIVADLGTLQRLNKIVGNGIAREMAFTASDLSAERALQVGFVNAVYENKEALLEAGRALAARIASLSPLVVQGTKVALNYAEEHSVEDSLFQVALWNAAFIKSDDAVEAMMAFMEKRPAKFRNRL
jgi:enoyl-CoA hydratase/carnithine racemase